MKINQWTLGLAAVGVVSLASVVNADEAKMNALQTALSATTISGYVDTSINYNNIDRANHSIPNTGEPFARPFPIQFLGTDKNDGFNLNAVQISISKALDESEWAAGYKIDLLFGPDAVGYNNSVNSVIGTRSLSSGTSEVAIEQAYVALRTPVGNGLDWKIGVFNGILGYESTDGINNPNFTRSYAKSWEPTAQTGLLGTYRFSEEIAVSGGVANMASPGINDKATGAFGDSRPDSWNEAWMASVALTVPKDSGFLSGSTLYAGWENGPSFNDAGNFVGFGGPGILPADGKQQRNYYVGATVNTPVTGLKVGAAYDQVENLYGINDNGAWDVALYASYQATEKLSFHGRAEAGKAKHAFESGFAVWNFVPGSGVDPKVKFWELTGTVQYDLWANVLTRLEIRYDEQKNEGFAGKNNGTGLYANVVYKF
jgi:hypothetical protein